MKSELYIKDVLSRSFDGRKIRYITIPDFQRPYCWSMENIQEILDDFEELRCLENGTYRDDQYYFGTIAFRECEQDLEILDGQQRITSFFLLAKVLWELSLKSRNSEIQKLGKEVDILLSGKPEKNGRSWEFTLNVNQPESQRHIREIYHELQIHYAVFASESKSCELVTQRL